MGTDAWTALGARVDMASFRPRLATGVEMVLVPTRDGPGYLMVASPDHRSHLRLQPWAEQAMVSMDGEHTVAELLVERMADQQGLAPGQLVDLVATLRDRGFLDPRPENPWATVEAAVAADRRRGLRSWFGRDLRIEWKNAGPAVEWLYHHGLKHAFNPVVVVIALLVALLGLAAFVAVARSGRYVLGTGSPPVESIVLIVLTLLLTVAHEGGHAIVQVHAGRKVAGAGFMIYFGAPAFYVDASDSQMMSRRDRVIQSAAGPGTELVLAGAASLFIYLVPDAGANQVLYKFALLNLLFIFLNLLPLLELDGYWILTDLIEVPDLRARASSFVRNDLWHKVRSGERLTLQQWGFTAYSVLGAIVTVGSLFLSFYFWRYMFGGLISALWNGGLGWRLLLIVLVVVVLGPVLRALLAFLRSVGRRVRAFAKRIQFRYETSWRIEAASMIDDLPAFEDLPVELLNDLAGRVTLGTYRAGQPVFRQGDRATAFYVVRRGQVSVETEHPDTGDVQTLSVLQRGDAFGELGLVESQPRSATVRAITEVELFEVSKGTFDHLLASAVHVPEFSLTLESLSELREIPVFAALPSDRLGDVLDVGAWVSVPPGDEVVVQGDPGDAFYAIRSGQADVVRDGRLVTTLSHGDYFGEAALLDDAPRNATVVARTPLRVFQLPRAGFDELVSDAFRQSVVLPPVGRDMEH
jgi:putative peptide zinc metalloprotease protein